MGRKELHPLPSLMAECMCLKRNSVGIADAGLVLSDRFFRLDFNIDKQNGIPACALSTQVDAAPSLPRIAIMSTRDMRDLAAKSTTRAGDTVTTLVKEASVCV